MCLHILSLGVLRKPGGADPPARTLSLETEALNSVISMTHPLNPSLENLSDSAEQLEDRFFPLFQHAAVGFAKVGLDCRWLRVNAKLCRITGYSESELLSMTFCDITHPDDLATDLDNMQKVMAGELDINVMEKRYFCKDGSLVWVHLTATLARNAQNEPDYFITVIEDITQRKEAERALKESEERYRLVVEGIHEGIWDWNLQTNELYWNDPIYEILGLSRKEYPVPTRETGRKTVHPDDRALIQSALDGHLTHHHKFHVEFRVILPCGGIRHVLSRAQAIRDENGIPIRMAGTLTDITERKQAETALEESRQALQVYARKLEQSNKELEHFATVASHDLQAPLRKIQLFSDRLQTRAREELSEESMGHLIRMQRAAERMQNLINSLLVMSKVSRYDKPFETVDMDKVAHDVLSDLEPAIQEVQASVEVGLMLTLEAAPPQMQQLLANLVSNALKFHRPDRPPVVHLSMSPVDEAWCELRVADNGIGFEEQYIDRIFEVFRRLHGDNRYPGTGMGLAICHKIVERHGGTITAQSTPGEGSVFIVKLPIKQEN